MARFANIAKLKELVLSERVSEKLAAEVRSNTGKDDFFTVFLSVCNKKERARVFHGSGKTLQAAWADAEKRLEDFRKKQDAKKWSGAAWAKADIVTSFEEIPTVDLNRVVVKYRWHNFARVGISFDSSFSMAFIEAEVNGNKLIKYHYSQNDINAGKVEYDSILINLENVTTT